MNKVFKLGNCNLIQVNTFNRNLKGGKYKPGRILNSCNLPEACFLFTTDALHILLTYDT